MKYDKYSTTRAEHLFKYRTDAFMRKLMDIVADNNTKELPPAFTHMTMTTTTLKDGSMHFALNFNCQHVMVEINHNYDALWKIENPRSSHHVIDLVHKKMLAAWVECCSKIKVPSRRSIERVIADET